MKKKRRQFWKKKAKKIKMKTNGKKNMWGNTVAIHSVLKKKTSKLLTQLNMKKIKSTKTILEKKS